MKSLRQRLNELSERAKGSECTKEEYHEAEVYEFLEFADDTLSPLFDAVNIANGNELGNAASQRVNCEHRTLQQSFFSQVIIPLIVSWANNYSFNQFDGRNEMTCRVCTDLIPILEKYYLVRKQDNKLIANELPLI